MGIVISFADIWSKIHYGTNLTNFDQIMVMESQGLTKVIKIHPEGAMYCMSVPDFMDVNPKVVEIFNTKSQM